MSTNAAKNSDALISSQKYTFNKELKKYVFHSEKKFGKNLVYSKDKIDTIIKLYSNFDKQPLTAGEISLKLDIPKDVIIYILKELKVTHDSLPFTEEVLGENEEDSLVDEMINSKAFNVLQKFEKADWKKTQEDAEKWRLLKHGKLSPFEEFLKKWNPPKLVPFKSNNLNDPKSDKVFTVVLSDLHFGASANSRYMFNRPDWSTEKTVEAVDKYATEIVKEVKSRNYKFNKCLIIGLGDLIHSALGKTARGTELIYDCIKEEQFDYALTSLLHFYKRMVELFGKVESHDVGGNHHYELDMALFRALNMYFKEDKRISFTHHASRPSAFKCGNTLIMMDHGADSKERVYVPTGAKLEKHVQSILINNQNLLHDVKTKLFIMGDRHHFEHIEFGTFEFIMFGTILGADEHANVNNWYNRARQSIMVLDNTGLKEIIHVYFD
jgi:hypothetical protein